MACLAKEAISPRTLTTRGCNATSTPRDGAVQLVMTPCDWCRVTGGHPPGGGAVRPDTGPLSLNYVFCFAMPATRRRRKAGELRRPGDLDPRAGTAHEREPDGDRAGHAVYHSTDAGAVSRRK